MTLFQTAITVEGQDGKIFMCDTIIYKDEPWLVLSWRGMPEGEPRKPARIVQLAVFEHQECSSSDWPSRYVVTYPIPKALFDESRIPAGFERSVIDYPEVSILIGNA